MVAALIAITPPASSQINNPESFVAEVYRHFVEAQVHHSDYEPPANIYTARLNRLFRRDQQWAKGEVGCLDFDFWVNGQDWTLTNVKVTDGTTTPDRRIVIATFSNIGMPQEIHFDFRAVGGRWLLDDVQSTKGWRWKLSEILRCPH